ncbi:hypothetical protein IMZ38_02860 [Thermosphaera chiliense]|uniref:Ferritin-like domain-containing protein n=1 Tax=Thermosphaera chiliense TaxID=3402707 RepID=A0A7M1UUU6_9CREN|nr:hypothetical protein [Thermosphaera aggregans]QOR94874.1 hypothetical protein IMZ38_02860 [Thermosphaera aggregans]
MIGKLIYCSVELERKVASLYQELASLAESGEQFASLLLKQIGLESMVHSEVLRSLGVSLGLYEETGECQTLIGDVWSRVEEAYSKIKQPGKADVRGVLKELVSLEGFVGEETYHRLLLPLLEKVLQDRDSLRLAKLVLEKIIQDEGFHEKAVNSILKY